ncbi:hypothetical protein BGZ67_002863 [Mortierella alpina]|nr:hypothetical protein BGZ67_002863 [Mortierella alpina]
MTIKHRAIKFNLQAITASLDPGCEPLIYGTPESPARIEGEVVLECNYECKGTTFVLTYAAVVDVIVNTVQDYHTDSTYFDKREFQFELMHPPGRPDHLTPNVYRFPFAFNISSEYPSSFDSSGARMRYLLEGRLIRKRSKAFKKTVVVHVHNTAVARDLISTSSTIPAPSGSALGLTTAGMDKEFNGPSNDLAEPEQDVISPPLWSPSETTLALVDTISSAETPNPTLQRFPGVWAGRLPYEVILPTLKLLWGQIIPITVRVYHSSDEKVVRIKVSVEQEMVIRAGVSICRSRHEALQAAWDCSGDDWPALTDLAKLSSSPDEKVQVHSPLWQKVLLFQVPFENAMKILPPTIDCKCLKIHYFLKVTLDLVPAAGKNQEAMESKN